MSSPFEYEWGIDYARLYSPQTRSFKRVKYPMPLGRAWYPTTARLHDGKVLVTGGFTDYGTDFCLGKSTHIIYIFF